MNKSLYKHYVFLDEINDLIKENLIKLKNVSIIINDNQNDKRSLEVEKSIIEFAKKRRICFLLKNNFQKCIKYRANGIYIDSKNKKTVKPIGLYKNFKILGSVHSQLEFYFKNQQRCEQVFLSPIFKNIKYLDSQILKPIKFNLMCLEWKKKIIALGGINSKNIKKIYLTKSYGIGFMSWIKQQA